MTDPTVIRLKEGPRRSVWLERPATGPARVVKRIQTVGLAGLRARRLARREHEVQRRLFAAGLAVPEPLGFASIGGAVELTQRWIEGARELVLLMPGRALGVDAPALPTPNGLPEVDRTSNDRAPLHLAPEHSAPEHIAPASLAPERLATALGRLLARAHTLGLDHPDVHEKNVLVDGAGALHLIDFHRARLLRAPDAAIARRDLVQLAAATRERVPVRLRQRALIAWWNAVDERARPEAPLATFAAAIEDAGRERRRSVLARAMKRWERPSSSSRTFSLREGRGMARAELDDAAIAELLERAWRADRFEVAGQLAGFDAGALVLVLHGESPQRTSAAFLACARLADHALDAARPLVYLRAPEPGALFAVPRSCAADSKPASAASPGALGRFFGALEDRGLALELRGGALHVDAEGRVWAVPPFTLHERALDRGGRPWNLGLAHLPHASAPNADGGARRTFLDAWRRAQNGGAALDRRLAAEIGDG